MSILKAVRGVLSTFWQLTREDWYYMDRKFIRIATGVISFSVAALFWFFFLRNIMPF